MTTYLARYERERGAWTVSFADPDVATWARTLEQARRHAREALAVTLGYDSVDAMSAAGVEVVDEVAGLPDDVAELAATRIDLERRLATVRERSDDAARNLAARGWSLRDIAGLLGVSYQRVGQVVGAAPPPKRTRRRAT
ncbi:MAG TPA: hypothetical protein VNA20_07035 [Frankiaceae bacterium]|nr:hypothetical protein [Frankiaceae bacterium]